MSDAVENGMEDSTPRDVRLLHLLLASQAIHQYDDRVPLQLMDFAYRYARGVLKDAMAYSEYVKSNTAAAHTDSGKNDSSTGANNNNTNHNADTTTTTRENNKDDKDSSGPTNNTLGQLTIEDIRLAIAARTQYQFKPTAPKELLLQLATERNKKSLPQVMGSWGIRLPPEKYCLTAREWDIE